MILNGCVESGAEEWVCPACGRRVLLRWPPNFERLVLEGGDETAIHVGGKGGVRLGDMAVRPAGIGEVPDTERRWLHENGIDWDGMPA
jgi:hypothetical protein